MHISTAVERFAAKILDRAPPSTKRFTVYSGPPPKGSGTFPRSFYFMSKIYSAVRKVDFFFINLDVGQNKTGQLILRIIVRNANFSVIATAKKQFDPFRSLHRHFRKCTVL